MRIPDVNVLIALARSDHPHHQAARAWLDGCLEVGDAWSVPDFVAVGFVRVVTHRRFHAGALRLEDAVGFLDDLRAQPTYVAWVTKPTTQHVFERLASAAGAAGPVISDAYVAALAHAYGATLVTFDRDFRRFSGLDVVELG